MATTIGALWLVLAVLVVAMSGAQGYTYTKHLDFGTTASVFLFSEGPMFASHDAPWGTGDSTVDVSAHLSASVPNNTASTVINMVFFNNDNAAVLGLSDNPADPDTALPQTCCDRALLNAGACEQLGTVLLRPGLQPEGVPPPITLSQAWPQSPDGVRDMVFNGSFDVTYSGTQWVMVAVCDALGSARHSDTQASITYWFKNPYGYLPGLWYALLPFYGVLAGCYCLGVVVYAGVFLANRNRLLLLQYMVLFVAVLGAVEVCSYFFMYVSKNESGIPPCCPATADFLAAVVLRVVKATLSRALLLSVCLGFGVVRPRLAAKTNLKIFLLSGAYLICSVTSSVQSAQTADVSQTVWDLLVMLCNFAYLFWIYYALSSIREQLRLSRQQAKLAMYDKLASTLKTFVALWILLSLAMVLVASGVLPLPWRWIWVIEKFWDVLNAVVLLVIAVIWAPSARTMQYSLYSQSAVGEGDDGEVDGMDLTAVGIELGGAQRFGAEAGGFEGAGDDYDGAAADDAFAIGSDGDSDDADGGDGGEHDDAASGHGSAGSGGTAHSDERSDGGDAEAGEAVDERATPEADDGGSPAPAGDAGAVGEPGDEPGDTGASTDAGSAAVAEGALLDDFAAATGTEGGDDASRGDAEPLK